MDVMEVGELGLKSTLDIIDDIRYTLVDHIHLDNCHLHIAYCID